MDNWMIAERVTQLRHEELLCEAEQERLIRRALATKSQQATWRERALLWLARIGQVWEMRRRSSANVHSKIGRERPANDPAPHRTSMSKCS